MIEVNDSNRQEIVDMLKGFIGKRHDVYIKAGRTATNHPIRSIDDKFVTCRWELLEVKLPINDIYHVEIWH